ncbi:hypothetical protein GCM10007049_10230 [Echinicola pacifica]|uniref:Por secretion system C-terminal sorting domain-containing protein n=1 Tax=Echinicola pacifica TaxID=346377 RepID=A0A918PRP0_9BACT|nr:T9SS type A sorting domain-containing protein [Echinicola pacifica]GGZ19687.1 hypothetical protein GCM10007049_10230 [Echinicola pacifica]
MRTVPATFLFRPISGRIYKIIFVILSPILILSLAHAQQPGTYRSLTSGDFNSAAIWETFDGSLWSPATVKPGPSNDVFIEFGHTVDLQSDEAVKSLYLNAQLNTLKKLGINGYNLSLYGSLNAYEGSAPGSPVGAWNTIDWIGNSESSRITFRGSSRIAIPSGAWSAFTTRSNFALVFEPDPGAVLSVQASVKASSITIKSGTVIQEGIPGVSCASFSFTNNPPTTIPYGILTIENGATLRSYCSDKITYRSEYSSIPAASLLLQEGAKLELHANTSSIDAVDIQLLGEVIFASNAGNQSFITSSMAGTMPPRVYHDIRFTNTANKILPGSLELTGDMIRSSGGEIIDNSSQVSFTGLYSQEVSGFELDISSVIIDKPTGLLSFDENVSSKGDFQMLAGELDFRDHRLAINTASLGIYNYQSGSWANLSGLDYRGIPGNLLPQNASFPFVDRYEEGLRMLQILGSHASAGEQLTIDYHQLPGVDHDANFYDLDGTLILYQLNSYFTISSPSIDPSGLMMRISAHELIVDDEADLRIVGDHIPATGSHQVGELSAGNPWARRSVRMDELNGKNFTIGSERVASILPLQWLSYQALTKGHMRQLSWSFSLEEETPALFTIHRSIGTIHQFEIIGQSQNHNGTTALFEDLDRLAPGYIYYQISFSTTYGQVVFSPVFSVLQPSDSLETEFYPNPYLAGELHIPGLDTVKDSQIIYAVLYLLSGEVQFNLGVEKKFFLAKLENQLQQVPTGHYILHINSPAGEITIRLIKE